MKNKRYVAYALVSVLLAMLVYLQFRTWRNFDWARFSETRPQDWSHIVHAVALIYLAYVVRAVRWKIFLKPVRPKASWTSLLAPTIIGFAGLALLGRPGELTRPYLIARRQNLPFSSQLGAWTVERIFDFGAYAILLVAAIFAGSALRADEHYSYFQKIGVGVVGFVLATTFAAVAVHLKGLEIADWIENRFAHLPADLALKAASRIREFRGGLNTIHGPVSMLAVTALSLLMWFMIVVAYQEVTHSYQGADLVTPSALEIPREKILVLMGASMVGSFVQLPGVGGGSQVATIATLQRVFHVPKELAASCGIMLWLVTFVAVVPLGLLLAHRERLSLRKLSAESEEAGEGTASVAQ